ncbi:xanthine dehydrogenase family protein molybdopterin-binding subunit [Streptomyces sp. NPDC047000]|uniref:xanthine dehydrogenase family protein molybdopterin-binding subunit n=1 Tax=Streptomyces sp. NPDC047000 TaxID=3155474 RepID=UPI00340B93FE
MNRVDAPAKVSGTARYPADETHPGLVHAVLVPAAVPVGRITGIDTSAALRAPGVLAVITHENAPEINDLPPYAFGPSPRNPLADATVRHHGQYVAVVVAGTRRQAADAGRLLEIAYEPGRPVVGLDDPDAEVLTNPFGLESTLGDVAEAFATAEVVLDETYGTAPQAPSPMGLFATVARWDGDRLTVHDSTQWPLFVRTALSTAFGVPESDVRVHCRYLGGGFGAGLRVWPHTVLAVLAARTVGRPVRIVLDRPQMFASLGHRAASRQRLRIAAGRDGRLSGIEHRVTTTVGVDEANMSFIVTGTADAYDCPNVATHDRQVRLSIPNPGPVRAPGHAELNFAVESAMDELAHRLGLDPIELRLRNFRSAHPVTGLPWASNALRDCYRAGADRFGWRARDPRPRSTRDGDTLVGWGMAGASFVWFAGPCAARITLDAQGCATVASVAPDLGTGTATVVTVLAAQRLGLPAERIRVLLGDSDLPASPPAGGSGLAMSVTGAVDAAADELMDKLADLAVTDERSPLYGQDREDLVAADGGLWRKGVGETYQELLARHDLEELTVEAASDPASGLADRGLTPSGPYAAHFAEVRVDEQLGTVRVSRLVTAADAGRLLNEKTARSQIQGGVVMGLGMALLEDLAYDRDTGRLANGTLGDYLVPVNADVPDHEVLFVGAPDPLNPGGVKGLGEIGVVGVAAAVANAVFHATGIRVRSLPVTLDKLLAC